MSLQDQLMKAGLVSKHDAKKANKAKHRALKSGKKVVNEAKELAAQKKQQQAERDKVLNQQRQSQAQQKAITAQIRQLIMLNSQARDSGDVAYNFSDSGKITKIWVTNTQQQGLVKGQLTIAKLDEHYQLIPTAAAEKISQRDDTYILSREDKQQTKSNEDDPYAEYQVPDDLMW